MDEIGKGEVEVGFTEDSMVIPVTNWDQFLLGHNIHYHTIHNKA